MGGEGLPLLPIESLMGKVGILMAKQQTQYLRVRGDSGQQRRIRICALLLGVLAFVPVGLRMYQLMVTDYELYANLALRNQSRSTSVAADRGMIYDCNMNILACNQSVETVYLNPRELKQTKADLNLVAEELSQILQLDSQWILKQAKDATMRYKRIAAGVETEVADQIRRFINENGISGIHLEPATKRYYPYGSLAAQVIGFTNASNTGSEGVEAAYNRYLEGKADTVITTKGNNEMDMPYSYEAYLDADAGSSVVLTLDATVQACLEKRMEEAIARYDVQNGAFGIVMNVNTGEILAMSTLGSYDPNDYLTIADEKTQQQLEQLRLEYLLQPQDSSVYTTGEQIYQTALREAQLKQWRNRCISDGYEPGSTFKVLTMAAALDSGAIDLETNFHCSGSEHIPGRSQLLHCWRSSGHGSEKTPQALQNSCNIAFAHIALKMGGETFYNYIEKFGILEKTGIDLSGESKGVFFDKAIVTDTDKWGTASLTSGSFGQTFKITPLQLVRAISAVVNGGYLLEPYLVSQVMDSQGNTILQQEPTVLHQVISEETSETMCRLMESVVTEGTAKNAGVSGFSIGGKTGTSEKIDVLDENGQPVLDKIVSFVGVAPMDDPEYIVLVALDTPSRQTGIYISGGVMAAPTVGAVMEDILPYLGVERVYDEDDPASQTVIMEDLTGMTAKEAQEHLKEKGLSAVIQGSEELVSSQIPAPGTQISGGSQVLLYMGEVPEEIVVTVPDFTGMHRQQASDTAGASGLYIRVKGNRSIEPNVVVTAQSVQKDTQVPKGTVIELEFTDTQATD